jgi:branched-chain amino acid transport system substrate-binding protein
MSGPTDAAMPIYEKAGIPMMSPAATNIELTKKGSAVFNRVAFTDAMQARFAAEYLYHKLGIRDLALIHDSTAYGSGIAEEVRKDFEALGGKIVGFEAITRGEADYSAPLVKIAAAKPQALYFGGSVQEGVILVNQMKITGLEGVIFFGDDGTFGSDFLTRTGVNGEGAYSTSFTLPESDRKTRFDAAYEKTYGIPPGKLSPFTWNGYDSTAPLILAIKSVAIIGGDGKLYIPRGALVTSVRNTRDYQGVTGTITCSPVGECSAAQPTFYVIQGGKWVEAPK